MARSLAAAFAACAAVGLAPVPRAAADPAPAGGSVHTPPGPYVSSVRWARYDTTGSPAGSLADDDRASLRVTPTPAGRRASLLDPIGPGDDAVGPAVRAWAEVLAAAPDADRPGMRAQFDCHWNFAELAEPGKASWNLEPWRPVVDDREMVATHCNPGDAEESN